MHSNHHDATPFTVDGKLDKKLNISWLLHEIKKFSNCASVLEFWCYHFLAGITFKKMYMTLQVNWHAW